MNKELEEYINEIPKLVNFMKTTRKYTISGFNYDYWIEYTEGLKTLLTPPNKEELKAEIIKELNETLSTKDKFNNNWWVCEDFKEGFMFWKLDNSKAINISKKGSLVGITGLPLSLASKIIKFFMEQTKEMKK